MNAAEPRTSSTGNFPANEDDRLEIRNQLERILAHPQFQNSRRYPALLRYVVERTLDGNGSSLKERTIGIEVFGREPNYDTNQDHTVRTSAGEVRKRLAQSMSSLIVMVKSESTCPRVRTCLNSGIGGGKIQRCTPRRAARRPWPQRKWQRRLWP